jgi:tetratricopeptide (TPR) repeat protein
MRTSVVFSDRTLLLAVLLVSGALSISGCAQLNTQSTSATSDKAAAAPEEQKNMDSQQEAPLLSLKQIVRLIEEGKHEQALAALKTFLAKDPKNQSARNLQRQLTVDPLKALGPAVSTYTVQSGDTLGGLAARFLGNAMNFIILGRYNHIKRGQDLQVGQTIKIPSVKKLRTLPDEPQAAPSREQTVDVPEVEPDGSESSAQVEVHAVPAPVVSAVKPEATAPKAAVKPKSPSGNTQALAAQQAGLAAMQKNRLVEAEQDFSKALAIDPGLEPAKTRVAQVRQKLVRQYHEAALVAYRKQHLDEAIALWDKALALDPGYEPALGYRARAQELKRRLGQLNAQ